MKIYTASPLPLSCDSWERDIVVLYRGFEALGHEAACVRLHSKDGADFPGVIQMSAGEMQSSEWWRQQACDLVVVNTWGNPEHDSLIKAIKASGARVVVRLDTNGYKSPWVGFLRYFVIARAIFSMESTGIGPVCKALAKTFVYAIPQVYDRRMLAHLSLADAIGIESEGARELFEKLLRFYRRDDLIEKLHIIRHPVVPEIDERVVPDGSVRENVIVAVGRWDSPQKDTPLLVETLGLVLGEHTDYRAKLFGGGEDVLNHHVSKLPPEVADRIGICGRRPHAEVLAAYGASKICLFTSVYEGCPISGGEALCLGCSLVGPPDVPAMRDLCAPEFGTLPASRKGCDLAESVSCEIAKWGEGSRDPHGISGLARDLFSVTKVCRLLLEHNRALPES